MEYAIVIAAAAALIIFLILRGKKRNRAAEPELPLTDPRRWTFLYSPGLPDHPRAGWEFDFPLYDGDPALSVPGVTQSVHYVTAPYDKPIAIGSTISFVAEIRAADGTVFNHKISLSNSGGTPTSARLMIEHKADDMIQEYWRWWPVDICMEMKPGTQFVSVQLDPSKWLSVQGKHADLNEETLAAFKECLANVGSLALTFGGGSYFGHGVNIVSGQATFILHDFSVS